MVFFLLHPSSCIRKLRNLFLNPTLLFQVEMRADVVKIVLDHKFGLLLYLIRHVIQKLSHFRYFRTLFREHAVKGKLHV